MDDRDGALKSHRVRADAMRVETGQSAWLLATVAALVASSSLSLGFAPTLSTMTLLASLALLSARGLRASAERMGPGAARALVLAGGALALDAALPLAARVAGGALGAQALVASLGASTSRAKASRWLLPLMGHGTVLAASVGLVVLRGALPPAILMGYASGFALLALHASWAQGSAPRASVAGWEVPLLAAMVAGVGAASLLYAREVVALALLRGATRPALAVALAAGAFALAILCAPPPAPRRRSGILLDVVAHGAAGIALLNVLFLGFSVVSGWSLRLVFALLFAWQLVVIGMEYRTLRHARRSRKRGPAARDAGLRPLTVVVPAANEEHVLPASLAANLAVDPRLRFLLVPATKSRDGTVALAHRLAAEHPERVRVVEGSTGSKAEDLNLAWREVDTDLVLLLDADETIDEGSLRRALAILDAEPDVGLVQGRKVSRAPGEGFLARFVSAERRYCTWMDHAMHGDELGSSHFGGSAALLRREVPPSLGGWTDRTMTEDIEFTLRLHLDGRWRIVYDPDVIVRESDPSTFSDLLKQRTRWSRGWAQCFALYFGKVVRSRERLGRKRAFGLAWLLVITVSALWTTFVPATLLMRMAGISPLLPVVVGVPLTLILLPSRLLAYGYAALRDPVIPLRFSPARFAELALQAYLWILLGWFVQIHALYLELSSAPRVWYVTGKRRAQKAAGA